MECRFRPVEKRRKLLLVSFDCYYRQLLLVERKQLVAERKLLPLSRAPWKQVTFSPSFLPFIPFRWLVCLFICLFVYLFIYLFIDEWIRPFHLIFPGRVCLFDKRGWNDDVRRGIGVDRWPLVSCGAWAIRGPGSRWREVAPGRRSHNALMLLWDWRPKLFRIQSTFL